jgi:hypothetical protein
MEGSSRKCRVLFGGALVVLFMTLLALYVLRHNKRWPPDSWYAPPPEGCAPFWNGDELARSDVYEVGEGGIDAAARILASYPCVELSPGQMVALVGKEFSAAS